MGHYIVQCVIFFNAIKGLSDKAILKFPEKGKEVIGVGGNHS